MYQSGKSGIIRESNQAVGSAHDTPQKSLKIKLMKTAKTTNEKWQKHAQLSSMLGVKLHQNLK